MNLFSVVTNRWQQEYTTYRPICSPAQVSLRYAVKTTAINLVEDLNYIFSIT
jgi:hypothetical protein